MSRTLVVGTVCRSPFAGVAVEWFHFGHSHAHCLPASVRRRVQCAPISHTHLVSAQSRQSRSPSRLTGAPTNVIPAAPTPGARVRSEVLPAVTHRPGQGHGSHPRQSHACAALSLVSPGDPLPCSWGTCRLGLSTHPEAQSGQGAASAPHPQVLPLLLRLTPRLLASATTEPAEEVPSSHSPGASVLQPHFSSCLSSPGEAQLPAPSASPAAGLPPAPHTRL